MTALRSTLACLPGLRSRSTFSWALHTTAGEQKIVEGSFSLPPGASNVQVYQGSGFDSALSNPIVICRGNH